MAKTQHLFVQKAPRHCSPASEKLHLLIASGLNLLDPLQYTLDHQNMRVGAARGGKSWGGISAEHSPVLCSLD